MSRSLENTLPFENRYPPPTPPPAIEFNCKSCNRPDDTDMVQCDQCDQWHHYQCVGVTHEVANCDWLCPTCQSAEIAGGGIPQTHASESEVRAHPSSHTSKQDNQSTSPCVPTYPPATSKLGDVTGEQNNLQIQLQRFEEERVLQEKRDLEYLNKKYILLSQINESAMRSPQVERVKAASHTPANTIGRPMPDNKLSGHDAGGCFQKTSCQTGDGALNASRTERNFSNNIFTSWAGFPTGAISNAQRRESNNNFQAVGGSSNSFLRDKLSSEHNPLSNQQLATRMVLQRDLPYFSGLVEEWPLFINSFENSTRSCGFSDDENLLRLQRCLKGKALEAVRARLLYPDQVSNVIATLKMLYGRPDAIVNSMIAKIRREPSPRADQVESLIPFALSVQNVAATMEHNGLRAHIENPCLLQELVDKLPPQTRLNWGMFKINVGAINISTFSDWLMRVAQAACEVSVAGVPKPTNIRQEKKRFTTVRANLHQEPSTNDKPKSVSCLICKESCETVDKCRKFLSFNLNDKWESVKRNAICRTCLISHPNRRCNVDAKCGVDGCSYRHHKLLHKYVAKNNNLQCSSVLLHQQNAKLLFKIVPVTVYNGDRRVDTFALLDDGSNVTLIEEKLARDLKVEGEEKPLCIKWTSNEHRVEESSKEITLRISAWNGNTTFILQRARTIQSLDLPHQTINLLELQKSFSHLRGLPIKPYENARPQILIGLDNSSLISVQKAREADTNQPIAVKTRLGWTVFGRCGLTCDSSKEYHSYHVCECSGMSNAMLEEMVKKFYTIENICPKTAKRVMSNDDAKAEQIMKENCRRVGKHFAVPLLWRGSYMKLPDSRPIAKQRLLCLEKRLKRDKVLSEIMNQQINDYVAKGYARKLSKEELNGNSDMVIWYLPVFPVTNPNKPQKVRMVWDAAAKVDGISLNSMLLTGPDNLPPLPAVLFQFRQRRFAICGDIKEMFHQVAIREEDQHAQRFLWRNKETGEIEDYLMKVMTFGSTCSPYCAQFVKDTNAMEFSNKYPRAAKAITDNHYVDDYLDSFDSEREAIEVTKSVKYVHQQAGFEIRNFMSNSAHVLAAMQQESNVDNFRELSANKLLGSTEKVLGLWWSPSDDSFSFLYNARILKWTLNEEGLVPTKRQVLKTLMSIFDPLGLIAPFLVYLKILLQEIWRSGVTWDEEIRTEQFEGWRKWIDRLPNMKTLRIRRPYLEQLQFNNNHKVELHVFVDASSSACAAAAYFRVSDGVRTEIALICAKTKVAPLKPISIPRMELEAALLGVRMAKMISDYHQVVTNNRTFWSDSQTVLCWIKNCKKKLRPYVAFRVGEILEESNPNEWKWVSSAENVADDGTRADDNTDFTADSRWFFGPSFLSRPEKEWPLQPLKLTTDEEVILLLHQEQPREPLVDFSRFSSWTKLRRAVAVVIAFINIIRHKRTRTKGILNIMVRDLQIADNYLLKTCQREVFSEEWNSLKLGKTRVPPDSSISKSSSLYKLSPYMDENEVIRIKGRIDACSHVPFSCKRPIVLPKRHYITSLIIQHFHERYHHLFSETVINEIRQVYYISGLRNAVKKVTKNCQDCKIINAAPRQPLMAELPAARMKAFTRPFTYVGMDYFGPISVIVGRRMEKRWGVLFTCLSVRAIHIEIAHSLSADSCILAVKRFCSRRGTPLEMWSDNGTNMKGASQELAEALAAMEINKVTEDCIQKGISWKFIPPASPHMGGSWERLIRSVKQALSRINIGRNPRDELLLSMMAEVENIINSRPLTYIPVDGETEEALTPNHFLLGTSNGAKVFGELTGDGVVLKKNWHACEQFGNVFWGRWLREYLPTLCRRTKWFESVKPLSEGDIVIVVDPSSPRGSWPKGRVIQVATGKDGQVRSAVVQTKTGVYTRPATKLAVLDVRRNEGDGNPMPNYRGEC